MQKFMRKLSVLGALGASFIEKMLEDKGIICASEYLSLTIELIW